MTVKKRDLHRSQVEAWEKINTEGLPVEEQIELFGKAFYAIEKRTLKTLSSVTLQVVLERARLQSVEKFPLLSVVKLESGGLGFAGLVRNAKNENAEKLIEALRYFLVELLNVLGNITAEILSEPLHKELHKVTRDYQQSKEVDEHETENIVESRIFRQISSGRKKPERT